MRELIPKLSLQTSSRVAEALDLPLRPKMSNQSAKTDVAGCVKEKRRIRNLICFNLLKGFRTNLQEDTPPPLFLSAFLLLKYITICTCKPQKVSCVCIWFHVLFVKHFVHVVVMQVQKVWTLSQHCSTIRPGIDIQSHQ